MNREEIKDLMNEVHKVYPRFEIGQGTIDAWADRLKDVPYKKAMHALDKHIDSDRGDYAPTLAYFIKASRTVEQTFFMDMSPRHYHIERGILVDDDGYEFWNTDNEPYYYNDMGHICRKNAEGEEIVIQR